MSGPAYLDFLGDGYVVRSADRGRLDRLQNEAESLLQAPWTILPPPSLVARRFGLPTKRPVQVTDRTLLRLVRLKQLEWDAG